MLQRLVVDTRQFIGCNIYLMILKTNNCLVVTYFTIGNSLILRYYKLITFPPSSAHHVIQVHCFNISLLTYVAFSSFSLD